MARHDISLIGALVALTALTASPARSEDVDPLRPGVAGHAFDHLGNIAEQADAVSASGFIIIYGTGCGGVGYHGLPPADKLAELLAASAKYNQHARARGIKVILGYVCATSIVGLDTFDRNWSPQFRARF